MKNWRYAWKILYKGQHERIKMEKKLTFKTRHFEELTICFGRESSPHRKYKLSKVN